MTESEMRREPSFASIVHVGIGRRRTARPWCAPVPPQRTVPQLARDGLLAACDDDHARCIVENVIDGTEVNDEAIWAYDGVYCTFAALRALLAPHTPTNSHRCVACREAWPCWTWREAYAWIVLYDPIHGRRVYDWCHHTIGDTTSLGLKPEPAKSHPKA